MPWVKFLLRNVSLLFAPYLTSGSNYVPKCNYNATNFWDTAAYLQSNATASENIPSDASGYPFVPGTRTVLLIVAAVLVVAGHLIKNRKFLVLPGPWGIWPVGVAYKLWDSKGRHRQMLSWSSGYKPCAAARVGTHKFVYLTTATAVQKLFSSAENEHLSKGFISRAIQPFVKEGLFTSEAVKWGERRRLLSRAFSVRSLMGYMDVYNKESMSLVHVIENTGFVRAANEEYDTGGPTSIKGSPIDEILYQHALRVICEATMGIDIWEIECFQNISLALGTCKNILMMRLLQPWLLVNWIWRWHPQYNHVHRTAALFDRFTAQVIEKRKEHVKLMGKEEEEEITPGVKPPFRSLIEEMLMAGIDNSGIMEEVNTFIAAGHETTAQTMQYVLFCLALNPKHQDKCREEVDRIFEDETLCPENEISYDALSHLKYLERCIMETLRLYPPVVTYFRRLDKPLIIDDNIEIPAGVTAGVYLPGLHRDPTYFSNPEAFDPDHFLPERVKSREQHAYMPFSAGKRSCIGFRFGINELKVMIARVLRSFIVDTSDTEDSVALVTELTLSPERGFNFIFTKRYL